MVHKNILITGSNRGIGFQLCKQLSQLNTTGNIIATTRSGSNSCDLNRLSAVNKKIKVLAFDTTDYTRYDRFLDDCHRIVGNRGLNLLVNNAGVMARDSLMSVTPDSLNDNFNVNSIAPLMVTQKLLPLLKMSANYGDPTAVVNISSTLGSTVGRVEAGKQYYPYRISKASLNMITKLLAYDLSEDHIRVIAVHPGWVKTDMGSKQALLEPEFAVKSLLKVILNIDSSLSGKLINYDGKVLQL
ncbi:unnamed protein product [Oppiella nova]|uniref:Short-chain dehydrogenase n=1 Tax=Oppiella nova TaxID=334625 RepID=A0A7R9MJE0_9ACAR|nr:unnamed protein product [Oppiella nova]CAG2178222.1 unnamed protein product [Oppiella nova]